MALRPLMLEKLTVARVQVDARKGVVLSDAVRESILLSAVQGCPVALDFNGTTHTIHGEELEKQVDRITNAMLS